MKLIRLIALMLAIALALIRPAAAQTNALDSAAAYSSWSNGQNLGFGFTPWLFANNNGVGGGFSGSYIDNSAKAISTSNDSFSLYANQGTGIQYSLAERSYTNALTQGLVFSVKFENDFINTSGYMGFAMRSSTNMTTLTNENLIIDADTAFAFYFIGGQTDYYIWDGNGSVTDSGIPFTTGGFTLQFAILTNNMYRLVVQSANGTTTLMTYPPQPLSGNAGGGTPVATFLGFNLHTGGSQNDYFNSLEVSSTSLIPPTITEIQPVNGAIYFDPATNALSFEVDSTFSTVATNSVKLFLNGVSQSNLVFSGTASNTVVTLPTNALSPNLVYSAVITASDVNGNFATNTFSFNTWSSNLFFVEAEDYNFNMGAYLFPPYPQYDALGVENPPAVLGTNYVDYYKPVPNDGGTNNYRPGDLVNTEPSGDVDHNGYAYQAQFGVTNYNLSFIQAGEWENYTRVFSNNAPVCAVYARMASFSASPTMDMELDANATATTTNQPRIPLGTFVYPPNTGLGTETYNFIPLTDFFSSNVLVKLTGTNTLRLTAFSTGYNLDYLVFVPSSNTNTLRPYVTSGYPYPTATGVALDTPITFTIANRQKTVTPSSIKLFVNSTNVTASLALSNNSAGTLVTYNPTNLLIANATNTLSAVYTDNGSVTITNTWTFTTENPAFIPTTYAQATSAHTNGGFTISVAKGDDNAPSLTFAPTVARAEAQLAGTLTDSFGQPYANEALNSGYYTETNVINYDINATDSVLLFPPAAGFPDLPGGTTNNIAMAALMYVHLTPGIYTFGVTSDDGFKFTTGTTPGSTNVTLGVFDGGRPSAETTFDFVVQTNGLYPMRLLYFKAQLGGDDVELYSINRTNGTRTLLNDSTVTNSIKVFQSGTAPLAVQLLNPYHTNSVTGFSFVTQSGHTHYVEYRTNLTAGTWQTLQTITGTGATTNVTDNAATNAARFYRVGTQ